MSSADEIEKLKRDIRLANQVSIIGLGQATRLSD